jgi:hypothetical protein
LTNITVDTAVNTCVVTNGSRRSWMRSTSSWAIHPAYGDPLDAIKDQHSVTLDLKPVTGAEYHTDFFPAVTPCRADDHRSVVAGRE